MHTHAPRGYHCPFCDLVAGVETDRNRETDIVFRNGATTAFVSPVHVFPRYDGDRLYESHAATRWASPAERASYAESLRRVLGRTG